MYFSSHLHCAVAPALRALFISGALLLNSAPAQAAASPKTWLPVSSVEGISEYRLANGLTILLMPDNSKPTVTVNMTYLVGSRHENYAQSGMAHLLEHMLFKGTPAHSRLDDEFNRRGMRSNASATEDRTHFYEIFESSDDNLKWALAMEADRMQNASIRPADLASEMTVVRNEFERGENSPSTLLLKRVQSVAYDWHNYGHSVIGNRNDIEHIKIDSLRDFYHQYYQPDNAVLTVAGQFDTARTLDWIQASFGKIARPARQLAQLKTEEPVQDGERSVVVRRQGDVQFVMIAYKIPAALHPDHNSISFAEEILTSAPHGRLHKQLVESGKVVQVFSFEVGRSAPGLAIIGAVVKKGESLDAARQALLDGIADFKKNPPTEAEVERVKRDSNNAYERVLNNPEVIGINLADFIAIGDWRLLFKDRDDTNLVSAEQVSAALNKYFVRDNSTTGLFIPEDHPQRIEMPAAPAVSEVLKDFHPAAQTARIESFMPTPANIDRRTEICQLGKLKAALLPKQTRGATVNVSFNLHWGDQTSLFGKATINQVANSLLSTGSSQYSRAELADQMARLKISGGLFSFQTTRENLSAALGLIAHVLRHPSFPDSEFNQLRDKMLVSLEASRNQPTAIVNRAMALHFNHFPKDDFRSTKSLDEAIADLKALQLADVKAYHQQFYGASSGEIAVVGDFDPAETKAAILSAFGDWESHAPYTRLPNERADPPAVRQVFDTPDKENAAYASSISLNLKEDDPDYPALRLANYMFGGGAGLNSRLMERIRQKDGLSYSGSSTLSVGDLDRVASFTITASAAPQNMARLESAIRQELARVLRDGFSQAELDKARSGLLQQRLQWRSKDSNVASGWSDNLFLGRHWAWTQGIDQKLGKVTLEQVNQVFRRYIDPARMSTFIALDQAKAGNRQ